MENGQSEVVRANEHWEGIGPTLFLAGPCSSKIDWRNDAIEKLHAIGFKHGAIFVPLPRKDWNYSHVEDFAWRVECLQRAHAVALWIPKECAFLGFTKSTLFKKCLAHTHVVVGHQKHMRNTPTQMQAHNVPVRHTLDATLTYAAWLAERACVQAESAA